jgi:SNF2 family DNA or RNA helicase
MINPRRYSSYWKWCNDFCEIIDDVIYIKSMNQQTGNLVTRQQTIKKIGGVKEDMEGVLRQQLRDVMIRRSIEELLPEIPEVTTIRHEVELSSQERKLYDQMNEFYFAQNENSDLGPEMIVFASNEVAKYTRLRQLASDWSIVSTGSEQIFRSSKMQALKEIIDDLDPEPVVIFSYFARVIDNVADMLNCPKLTGNTPRNDRAQIQSAFQSGQFRCIAGTIGTMSESIDLFRARHVIFLDFDWTPARNDEQAIGRVRRFGQQSDRIFKHAIIARDTIDEYVEEVLANKQAVIESLTGKSWRDVT